MSREHRFSLPHLTAVTKRLCLVSVFVLCCFYNEKPQCSVITQHKFMIFQFQRSEVQKGSWEAKIQVLARLFLSRASRGRLFFVVSSFQRLPPFLVGGSLPSSKPATAIQVFLILPRNSSFKELWWLHWPTCMTQANLLGLRSADMQLEYHLQA